jgi:hypothetical protein
MEVGDVGTDWDGIRKDLADDRRKSKKHRTPLEWVLEVALLLFVLAFIGTIGWRLTHEPLIHDDTPPGVECPQVEGC